jgi:hypothetical protein
MSADNIIKFAEVEYRPEDFEFQQGPLSKPKTQNVLRKPPKTQATSRKLQNMRAREASFI